MASSPQPGESYTRLSNKLYDQILMRDFTKRQRLILDLIIRLSYGCSKDTARIPRYKHFEVCGVSRKKITEELRTLKCHNIIDWDVTTGDYWLNTDCGTWEIPVPSENNVVCLKELLKINISISQRLKHKGLNQPQNGELVVRRNPRNDGKLHPKMGVSMSPFWGHDSPKTIDPERDKEMQISNDIYLDKKIIANPIHGLNGDAPEDCPQQESIQAEIADGSKVNRYERWADRQRTGLFTNGGSLHGIIRSNCNEDDELERIQAKWTTT